MDTRNIKTRPIFYRGISLKDYLRKSSLLHQNLQYPDDETILLDENKTPVIIDNSFIHTEPFDPEHPHIRQETYYTTEKRLPAQKSNIELPTLRTKSKFKFHNHSHPTDRNSTDTSIGSSFDLNISLLP